MEIERKWLLKELPDIQEEKRVRITQGYISIHPEVRIRSYEVISGKDQGHIDYLITVKGDGDLVREEVEKYITQDEFERLAKLIGRPLIEKDYWKYRFYGYVLECAVVDPGTKDAFLYGEIEFPSEEKANAYIMPLEGAVDVTCDRRYKMKNYWVRTRIENPKAAKERYQEFLDARSTLCAFCGECYVPNLVNAVCHVEKLAEKLRRRALKDGLIEEEKQNES